MKKNLNLLKKFGIYVKSNLSLNKFCSEIKIKSEWRKFHRNNIINVKNKSLNDENYNSTFHLIEKDSSKNNNVRSKNNFRKNRM